MIEWVSVNVRVPENRRFVIAWGRGGISFAGYQPRGESFLGSTRYNPSPYGGHFDCEVGRHFSWCSVTHWAEITPPVEERERDSQVSAPTARDR